MTLVLYHNPISTCSQKVRIALAEKGLEYEPHLMRFSRRDHLSDWYLKINPNGVIPAVVHDGAYITDSSVICEYLEDVFPEPPLAPRDPVSRAAMRAWMRYLEEVPTVAIRAPSFNARFLPVFQTMNQETFGKMVEKSPLRQGFYRQMGQTGFPEEKIQESLAQLAKCLDRVERALEGRPYLMGEMFTIADIVLTPTVVRLEDIGKAGMWDNLPRVAAWYERIHARPSFDIAYMRGSRVSPDKMAEALAFA